jgi:GT2 family glycosyltransferase
MKLSVVILNYNVKYFIDLCLQSVLAATTNLDSEIIVVDNASVDGSVPWIKSQFPQVKLIENQENLGFPKGNNIGVAQAKGEYVCILNPDTVIAEDTFFKALEFMEQNQQLAIMGPKLIDGSGRFLKESKRGVPTPWVAFTKVTGLYKIDPQLFGKYYNLKLPESQPGVTDVLVGACMFMKRDHYLALKGFDEACFMYSDDIDLSYRSLQLGKSNFYNPDINIIHYKGESTPKDFAYQMMFREAMNYFYTKHFHVSNVVKIWIKFATNTFSFLKRFRGVRSVKNTKTPSRYWLVSSELDLKIGVNKNIPFMHTDHCISLSKYKNTGTELILDPNTISFKEIIKFMSEYGSGFSYKILSSDKNHAVGSNSSNAKGEVLVMS